jgi:hypothetical protein
MKMSDKIFDLEQKIMQAWNVVDDIDMLYYYFGDNPKFAGMSAAAEDEMGSLMLGLRSLYSVKFDNMFNSFEDLIKEYHERGHQIELLEEKLRIATNERESLDL